MVIKKIFSNLKVSSNVNKSDLLLKRVNISNLSVKAANNSNLSLKTVNDSMDLFKSCFKDFSTNLTEENSIYVVNNDYDLGGKTVTIPENCILLFIGGHIGNGTLNGQNTVIKSENASDIFKGINISGTWNNEVSYSKWFDFDGIDDTRNLQNLFNFRGTISLEENRVFVVKTVLFPIANDEINNFMMRGYSNTHIKGNGATIKLADGVLNEKNAQLISLEPKIKSFSIEDLTIDGNSIGNKFSGSGKFKSARFIDEQRGGEDIRIERCKFLNCAGRNCVLVAYRKISEGEEDLRDNLIIRDCIFKNGGAYISDGTLNVNQSDFSFVYSDFRNTIVDNCKFIECDLDTKDAINGISYDTRKSYLFSNINDPHYPNSPKVYTDDSDGVYHLEPKQANKTLNNFRFWCGGVELHGSNSSCVNSLFMGCVPGIYLTKVEIQNELIPTENITICDNIMKDCYGGITFFHLKDSAYRNINIHGNTIESIGVSYTIQQNTGVDFEIEYENVEISNNTIISPIGKGILFNSLTKNCRITNNTILVALWGITSECKFKQDGLIIADNVIKLTNTNCYGIKLSLNNTNTATLSDAMICANRISFKNCDMTHNFGISGFECLDGKKSYNTSFVQIFDNVGINCNLINTVVDYETLKNKYGVIIKENNYSLSIDKNILTIS